MSDESVLKHLKQQVGTLKLSEAIRIGAAMRPQGRDVYFAHGKSCALGAAYEAIIGFPPRPNTADMFNFESYLEDRLDTPQIVRQEIIRRNDSGYTREQIADWLAERGL